MTEKVAVKRVDMRQHLTHEFSIASCLIDAPDSDRKHRRLRDTGGTAFTPANFRKRIMSRNLPVHDVRDHTILELARHEQSQFIFCPLDVDITQCDGMKTTIPKPLERIRVRGGDSVCQLPVMAQIGIVDGLNSLF